ncbi:protein FAM177A1 [Labrus mixtus]|uniref:protein FAM177A1 n=1 Tax=Labrus mixtus TaxID=508554 RepID=UPI0029C088FC|nr:protein FAM177A1 [Labrus mixtus]
MNASNQEKRIIHFSSGETIEEEDSEEEEEEEEAPEGCPFKEPTERARFSFKKVAILVGRISLMTCDFLGERLAGALGLNAAKYQYAIDHHDHNHKTQKSQTPDNPMEEDAEILHVSHGRDGSHYGATGDSGCPADSQNEKTNEGHHNRSYQADVE